MQLTDLFFELIGQTYRKVGHVMLAPANRFLILGVIGREGEGINIFE